MSGDYNDDGDYVGPPASQAYLENEAWKSATYMPRSAGAGRPTLAPGVRMVHQMLSLSPAQVAWLKAQPNGMSAAARNAIAKAMQAQADNAARAALQAAAPVATSDSFD